MNKLVEIIKSIYNIKELRDRIIFTLGLLLVYRLGAQVVLPGVDSLALSDLSSRSEGGGLLGILNAFTGGAFANASIFALGIMPYISASIVVQLMGVALPYLQNIMQVPSLEKIIISRGVGAAVSDKKLIDHAVEELTLISGQKAIATLSKKDVASFKLRKGTPIGAKVTLRGDRMYEFLDRLITIALPRVRDFQGIKADGFDGRGNYNLGIKEQIIFPEINIDKVNKIAGMDITFVTNTNSNKEAKALLTNLGLPFKK